MRAGGVLVTAPFLPSGVPSYLCSPKPRISVEVFVFIELQGGPPTASMSIQIECAFPQIVALTWAFVTKNRFENRTNGVA